MVSLTFHASGLVGSIPVPVVMLNPQHARMMAGMLTGTYIRHHTGSPRSRLAVNFGRGCLAVSCLPVNVHGRP